MNLTVEKPRSAKDRLAGLVSLKRVIDKAKARNAGTLGEYDYDCPHDKPLFEFLGVTGDEFARKVNELGSDEAIAAWVKSDLLAGKSERDIEEFNERRMRWHPDPGSHSEHYFNDLRSKIAPDRNDVVTWFDLLDIDEGRPVSKATSLN